MEIFGKLDDSPFTYQRFKLLIFDRSITNFYRRRSLSILHQSLITYEVIFFYIRVKTFIKQVLS